MSSGRLLIPITLLIFVMPTSAEVYHWKDSDGPSHYSDSRNALPSGTLVGQRTNFRESLSYAFYLGYQKLKGDTSDEITDEVVITPEQGYFWFRADITGVIEGKDYEWTFNIKDADQVVVMSKKGSILHNRSGSIYIMGKALPKTYHTSGLWRFECFIDGVKLFEESKPILNGF